MMKKELTEMNQRMENNLLGLKEVTKVIITHLRAEMEGLKSSQQEIEARVQILEKNQEKVEETGTDLTRAGTDGSGKM